MEANTAHPRLSAKEERRELVKRVVDQAPPLSPETRAAIRVLFRPMAVTR